MQSWLHKVPLQILSDGEVAPVILDFAMSKISGNGLF